MESNLVNKKPISILVTGSQGQLGKTINELYSNNSLGLDFTFVNKSELDITIKEDIERIFKNKRFHYCINCAAYTNVEQAEKTPEMAYKINAEGTKNLVEFCKEYQTTLVHISTDYVFDGEKGSPYTVDDLPNPINEYGKSKLLGEKYIQDAMNNYFIVRTSWLYSKKYGKNFYKTILELAKTKTELFITVDQIGCPTNTESLAKHIISLIKNNSKFYGIKHFSDKEIMTWHEFAKQILFELKLSKKIKVVKTNNYVTFASRPKNSVLASN